VKVGDLVRYKCKHFGVHPKLYVVIDEFRWYVHLGGMHPSQVVDKKDLEVIKCPKLD
jgi:hypothetical protein